MALPNRFEEHGRGFATADDAARVPAGTPATSAASPATGVLHSSAEVSIAPAADEGDAVAALPTSEAVDTDALAREARELAREVRRQSTDLMDLMAMPLDDRLALRLGRRERRRLETFERLVAVSRDILFAENLKQISVEDITTGADTGKGTFFNYFPSKEQVVPSQLALIWRELAASVARVERDGVPAPVAVVDRFVDYLCPPTGEWLTYEQYLMQGLLDPDVRKSFAARLVHNAALYIRMMDLGQRQGTVRTDVSAEELGRHIHTTLVGLTVLYWIHGAPPSRDAVREVATIAIAAIKPPVATAAAPERAKKAAAGRTAKKPAQAGTRRAKSTARTQSKASVRTKKRAASTRTVKAKKRR